LLLLAAATVAHFPPVPPPPVRVQLGGVVYPLPAAVRLTAIPFVSVAVQVAPVPPSPPVIVQAGVEV
jgi:hypothetical protein